MLTGSEDRFMLCLSRPEMFGFITKGFGEACTLGYARTRNTHTQRHLQFLNVTHALALLPYSVDGGLNDP